MLLRLGFRLRFHAGFPLRFLPGGGAGEVQSGRVGMGREGGWGGAPRVRLQHLRRIRSGSAHLWSSLILCFGSVSFFAKSGSLLGIPPLVNSSRLWSSLVVSDYLWSLLVVWSFLVASGRLVILIVSAYLWLPLVAPVRLLPFLIISG